MHDHPGHCYYNKHSGQDEFIVLSIYFSVGNIDHPIEEATVKETSISLEIVYLKTLFKNIDVWMGSMDGIELSLFVIEILDK